MTGSPMTGDYAQLLLGLCAGALLAMAAAMLRSPRPTVRWSGFLFFACSAAFATKLWSDAAGVVPFEFNCVVRTLAMMSVGWFWLMVMSLFADCDRFRARMYAAPGSLALVGVLNQLPFSELHSVSWLAGILMQAGFAIAALLIVVRSWKGDLVESRRRVRGPFMVAVSLYILSLNGVDLWIMVGDVPDWYPMFNASLLASIVLCGAFTFLDPRAEMFGEQHVRAPIQPDPAGLAIQTSSPGELNGTSHASPPADPGRIPRPASAMNSMPAGLDRATRADLDRLECLMSRDQVWKEEGLTIASLALRAQMPETQLRRLINDCLGYRNFPSYVNAHRISAAKTRLADPREARISISTIAYDIGFASLGPFNRAFKEEAGVSPSEWRRKALEEPSPIPVPV